MTIEEHKKNIREMIPQKGMKCPVCETHLSKKTAFKNWIAYYRPLCMPCEILEQIKEGGKYQDMKLHKGTE